MTTSSNPRSETERSAEKAVVKAEKRAEAKKKWAKYAYHVLAGLAVGTLALGTVVYHQLEGWSWVDSFYFSVVAGTTVGFGDLSPTSDGSKLFTVAYIVSSIGIIGTFLNQRLKYHGMVHKRAKQAAAAAEQSDTD